MTHFPIADIQVSSWIVRDVNKNTDFYARLRDSIRLRGLLVPVILNQNEMGLSLVIGLHRFEACRDLGHKMIPGVARQFSTEEIHIIQLSESIHVCEQKPIDMSKAILRLLSMQKEGFTLSMMASTLSVSTKWIEDRIGLGKLNANLLGYAQDGVISLANAYMLAKLPLDEQHAYGGRAISEPSCSFVNAISQRLKQIREARRKKR